MWWHPQSMGNPEAEKGSSRKAILKCLRNAASFLKELAEVPAAEEGGSVHMWRAGFHAII